MNHLLSATILLFAVWPVYYILLRYSSRYSLNRLFLLLAMVAVVTLPFIEFSSPAPVVTQSIQGSISYLEEGVITGGASIDPVPKEIRHDEKGEEILIANRTGVTFFFLPKIYYFGLGLMTLVLGFRLLFILRLHLRSRPNLIKSYRLLHTRAKPGQAFTFGWNLYFSEDVPNGPDFEYILNHERVHARQLHSLDILLSEVFLCIFWFHPTAWWLRANMRANLEYLVDQAMISNGSDRRDYQLALVRQSQGAYGLALALPFSEPSLKSRIVRMTGMPKYRIVALIATVALVFWLGVSLLVINGNLDADVPQGKEYLAAAAHPGDPYYDYYQNSLPEELTSLEIYANRMVTLDEYLQLRAILSKVPGANLYVHKQAFDEGYSLELRYGNQEVGAIHELKSGPSDRYVYMLGIEKLGDYFPTAMYLDNKYEGPSGMPDQLLHETTKIQPENTPNLFLLNPETMGNKLMVFVNQKQIKLVETASVRVFPGSELKASDVSVKVNGVNVSTLGAASWPEVLVEARALKSPKQRIERLLKVKVGAIKAFSLVSSGPCDCTYRDWYEGYGFLKDQPVLAYYNDRKVSLDFLLDTKFGDNAMIQHGVIYDTPMGRYALQVLDDYPDVEAVRSRRVFKVDLSGREATPDGEDVTPITPNDATHQVAAMNAIEIAALYNGKAVEINLFFKRLPMPSEVDQINGYLEQLIQKKINVFQDCTKPIGDYSLQLGTKGTNFFGFHGWPAGSRQEEPVRLQIRKDGSGGSGNATFRPTPLPNGAPDVDVLVRINEEWFPVSSAGAIPYSYATLDPAPLKIKLRCLLELTSENKGDYNIGTATHSSFSNSTIGEEVNDLLKSQNIEDLPIRYFIGDKEVSADKFNNQRARKGMILSMASRTEGPADRVIARLDY